MKNKIDPIEKLNNDVREFLDNSSMVYISFNLTVWTQLSYKNPGLTISQALQENYTTDLSIGKYSMAGKSFKTRDNMIMLVNRGQLDSVDIFPTVQNNNLMNIDERSYIKIFNSLDDISKTTLATYCYGDRAKWNHAFKRFVSIYPNLINVDFIFKHIGLKTIPESKPFTYNMECFTTAINTLKAWPNYPEFPHSNYLPELRCFIKNSSTVLKKPQAQQLLKEYISEHLPEYIDEFKDYMPDIYNRGQGFAVSTMQSITIPIHKGYLQADVKVYSQFNSQGLTDYNKYMEKITSKLNQPLIKKQLNVENIGVGGMTTADSMYYLYITPKDINDLKIDFVKFITETITLTAPKPFEEYDSLIQKTINYFILSKELPDTPQKIIKRAKV